MYVEVFMQDNMNVPSDDVGCRRRCLPRDAWCLWLTILLRLDLHLCEYVQSDVIDACTYLI